MRNISAPAFTGTCELLLRGLHLILRPRTRRAFPPSTSHHRQILPESTHPPQLVPYAQKIAVDRVQGALWRPPTPGAPGLLRTSVNALNQEGSSRSLVALFRSAQRTKALQGGAAVRAPTIHRIAMP